MKRLGRWLFNIAAVVSGVLCTATVIFSLRSYDRNVGNSFFIATRWCTLAAMYVNEGAFTFFVRPIRPRRELEMGSHSAYGLLPKLTEGPLLPTHGWTWRGCGLIWHSSSDRAVKLDPMMIEIRTALARLRSTPLPTTGVYAEDRSATIRDLSAELEYASAAVKPLRDFTFTIRGWQLFLLTLIVPGLRLYMICQRPKLFGAVCCARCGYDLRATPERCPECGAVPDAAEKRRP